MLSVVLSRLCILLCGTLYPAYASFKAVSAKSIEEYIKWMIYWIVFALFSALEIFTDIFLTWFPFYYEIKIIFILWLLPSLGNAAPMIYKTVINPLLKHHEAEIDENIAQLAENGQGLILRYITVTAVYVGRFVMEFINKRFPKSALNFLQQAPSTVIISELNNEQPTQNEMPETSNRTRSRKNPRSTSTTDTAARKERKGRATKSDLIIQLQ